MTSSEQLEQRLYQSVAAQENYFQGDNIDVCKK